MRVGGGQFGRDCRRPSVKFFQNIERRRERLSSEMVVGDSVGFFGAFPDGPYEFRYFPYLLLRVQIVVARITPGVFFEPVLIVAAVKTKVAQPGCDPGRRSYRLANHRLVHIADSYPVLAQAAVESIPG